MVTCVDGYAIIGIGCRFPGGAVSSEAYWELLAGEECAISQVPSDRWSLEGFYDPRPDIPARSYSKWGGFLDSVSDFDPAFFRLSQRDCEAMDPQQRLLLEIVCEAAQDAGYPLSRLSTARTGVFIGVSNTDYGLLQRRRQKSAEPQAGTGTALSIVANRISNQFDLSGPSMGLDTACSSSLVALDAACRHLQTGTCNLAIVGGVNILLDPHLFVTFCRAHMLSPTGRIRAFDAAADGFVRGEGAGVVLLKPVRAALDDNDRIYAVVKGTAVNQDGATGTITAPNKAAQVAMMRDLVAATGYASDELTFVEAHGTGTPVGDPIEAAAVGEVFGGPDRSAPLLIGSSKTNIGHLEPAAGIAGLIKAALALDRGALPASLGYEQENPAIGLAANNLKVADRLSALPGIAGRRSGLVNSFGFGGTNACALLSDRPADRAAGSGKRVHAVGGADRAPGPVLVPLSAPTREHLAAYARSLADALANHGQLAGRSLSEIAATLAQKRDHFDERAVVMAKTLDELREGLVGIAEGRTWPRGADTPPPRAQVGTANHARQVVFTTTGQGGQWWNMGRCLLEQHPVFRKAVLDFDETFTRVAGWSVMDVLAAEEETPAIHDAAITPAVMFAFQTALAAVWRSFGVKPALLIGHSFGEVTAAFLADSLDVRDVAHLVNHRGLIRGQVPRTGAMAALGMGAEQASELLPGDGSIEIGGYNSPTMVTLTGEEAAIDDLIARLSADDPGLLARKLALDFAYHSSWFAPVEDAFKEAVGTLSYRAPNIPVISTVTGRPQTEFGADYWWRNLRYPVRYQQAVDFALQSGADTFVELGPHRTLSSMTASCAAAAGHDILTVSTLYRQWDDFDAVACAAGELYVNGVDLDWPLLHEQVPGDLKLPLLPWRHQRVWQEPEEVVYDLRPSSWHPLLGQREASPVPIWSNELSLASCPVLAEHRINGISVFPAAAYIEMMRAAGTELLATSSLELSDVTFPEALYIDADADLQLHTVFDQSRGRIAIYSRERGGGDAWTLRAAGNLLALGSGLNIEMPELPAAVSNTTAFYRALSDRGYGYGPAFRGLSGLGHVGDVVVGQAEVVADPGFEDCGLDPCLLDACLQALIALNEGTIDDGVLRVPHRLECVRITGHVRGRANVSAAVQDADGRCNVSVFSDDGHPRVSITGIELGVVAGAQSSMARAPDAATFILEHYQKHLHPAANANDSLPNTDRSYALVACAADKLASALASDLIGDGADVSRFAPDDCKMHSILVGNTLERPPADIIFIAPEPSADTVAPDNDPGAVLRPVEALLGLGRALAELDGSASDGDGRRQRTLWVVTRNSVQLPNGMPPTQFEAVQRGLHGFARTLALECPHVQVRLVDLDTAHGSRSAFLAMLQMPVGEETEIVLRDGELFVPRLQVCDDVTALAPRLVPYGRLQRDAASGLGYALQSSSGIGIDGLSWAAIPVCAPTSGELRVEVVSAGLNFRDVMAVSGLLPAEAEHDDARMALGLEFAGIVREVAPGVSGFASGDRVFGLARGALRNSICLPAELIQKIPDAVTFSEAATLPVAYVTAHYALNVLARVRPGERVLIHSAAGGLGLAAVSLALAADCVVFATAGSAAKRSYLAELGVQHVMDSRTLAFADTVMTLTDGRGVDVILNALPGPYIAKGLSCLAPFGRFVELGKRDVYADSAIGMKALRRNISLYVADLADMIEARPADVQALLGDVRLLVSEGRIQPLPLQEYEAGEIREAFGYFAKARHIGKLVVRVDMPDLDVAVPEETVDGVKSGGFAVSPNASYLITGGTRGFGFVVARWLAEQGAGRVVLASRSGRLPSAERRQMQALCAAGHDVQVEEVDVCDGAAVSQLIARFAGCDRPLSGIVHAAVTYDDVRLADIKREHLKSVFAAKVMGAINLTEAVCEASCTLDFFVSFSSLAQVVGWPGQANYAAANACLEGLTAWQRARGVPAQCINWGALGQAGQVARNQAMTQYLEAAGWVAMPNDVALDAFSRVLKCAAPNLTFAAADWPALASGHQALAAMPRVSALLAGLEQDGRDMSRQLAAQPMPQRLRAAELFVRNEVGNVLRMPVAQFSETDRLEDVGIDSLSTFELKTRLERLLGCSLPMGRFVSATTFEGIAQIICEVVSEDDTI